MMFEPWTLDTCDDCQVCLNCRMNKTMPEKCLTCSRLVKEFIIERDRLRYQMYLDGQH